MDGNDIETVVRGIVAHRDIQRLVIFLHPHKQTFREGFCSWALLNNLALSQYPYGLRSGNTAFLCSQEGMVAPRDTSGAGCALDNSDIERHVSYIG
jgi:hypothetical protein